MFQIMKLSSHSHKRKKREKCKQVGMCVCPCTRARTHTQKCSDPGLLVKGNAMAFGDREQYEPKWPSLSSWVSRPCCWEKELRKVLLILILKTWNVFRDETSGQRKNTKISQGSPQIVNGNTKQFMAEDKHEGRVLHSCMGHKDRWHMMVAGALEHQCSDPTYWDSRLLNQLSAFQTIVSSSQGCKKHQNPKIPIFPPKIAKHAKKHTIKTIL